MERRAFNPAGGLGFSYDGCRDQVIEQSKISVKGQKLSSPVSPRCQLVKGNQNINFNFLQMIGVEDDLRLSSLLILSKKRTGIAAVLSHPHCIDDCTRFLYYSWICRTEEFYQKNTRIQDIIGLKTPQRNATHIITKVCFGIDLVIVLQLPSKTEILQKIDRILDKISRVLPKDKNCIFQLNSDENDLFKNVLRTTVYSNEPTFNGFDDISDIIRTINTIKRSSSSCFPVTYTLQSVTSLYSTNTIGSVKFSPLPAELRDRIEQHILRVRNRMKYVKVSLNEELPELLCGHLPHLLKEAHGQYSEVKERFREEIQRFLMLVLAARRDQANAVREINRALSDPEAVSMEDNIHKLIQYANALKVKGQFITNLRQKKFDYWNAAESNLDQSNSLGIIERMLSNNDARNRTLCSSDTLNKKNESKLIELCRILTEEHENTPKLHLIYLDFSYSLFQLQDLVILSSPAIRQHNTQSIPPVPLLTNVPKPSSSAPLTNEIINIVLLGETGVGKSTFINALANYLTFGSLEQAQSNEPVVLIPVSFTMTIGDHFEEQIVKFGESDSSNNENFNKTGQSVTQHCRSYILDLKENDRKLRIIDTPGFGDTRGLDQDDQNMEHILQYIQNLTHLHAVCFLLKPNSSRLNMFFRTCLTQLFSFLAPTARGNVIFCFTNGRSTFYTPGDTAPLLKTMLQSLSITDISFKKENTFCFDSESFRYLVALQNDVKFTEADKHEYETSWSTSVKESNRLVDYINKQLVVYQMKNGWQSLKGAQFIISHMIRPMLEAMRNILRNIVLCKENLSDQFIELRSTSVHYTATRCLSCKSNPERIDAFWVIPTVSHEVQDHCNLCSCPLDQHVPVGYILEHRCLYDAASHHQNATKDILEILCTVSVEFGHFLMHTAHSAKGDPFLNGFKEMIDEEKQVCQTQKSSEFNLYLVKRIIKLQELYEACRQKMSEKKSNQESIDLPAIYRLIDSISKYPMVHEQMVAVKQSQYMMMKDYEYEVQTI